MQLQAGKHFSLKFQLKIIRGIQTALIFSFRILNKGSVYLVYLKKDS